MKGIAMEFESVKTALKDVQSLIFNLIARLYLNIFYDTYNIRADYV